MTARNGAPLDRHSYIRNWILLLRGRYAQTYLVRSTRYNMRSVLLASVTTLLATSNAQTHGEGEEGSSMGPVAFMWPSDRKQS